MSAEPGRVWGGLTTPEREQRRREQFLAAGLEVFGERGWATTTVQDICRAAKLSQRYFYEQFARREALFLAVVDRASDEVEAVVRAAAAVPNRSPQQRAEGVLTALAEHFTADPRAVRVTLVETFATPEFRARRSVLVGAFGALASELMVGLSPDPKHVDRRSLELSALVLSGGIAEALIASVSGRAPAEATELVAHLTALYTAAAAMATA
jgi:AcrR family transcriptional regulator